MGAIAEKLGAKEAGCDLPQPDPDWISDIIDTLQEEADEAEELEDELL